MAWGFSDLHHSHSFTDNWLKTGPLNSALALGIYDFFQYGLKTGKSLASPHIGYIFVCVSIARTMQKLSKAGALSLTQW